TERGVLIPKRMFNGVKEVEIKKEDNAVIVIPIDEDDLIFKLGKNPISSGMTDGSINHDKYLYGKHL
ncbi:MAG: hypothetical protein FJ218_10185, partial [Ignavibacteria bacterium]|nr:hypothetical protein [Ignavibacteria bacterium]